MYNVNSNKQLTINKQHRLGSHKKQHLLFSLVHLIYVMCIFKYILLVLVFSIFLSAQTPQQFNLDPYNPTYEPNVILVKFKDDASLSKSLAKGIVTTGISAIDQLNQTYQVESMEKVFHNAQPRLSKPTFKDPSGKIHEVPNLDKIYKLKYKADIDPKEIIKEYQSNPEVEYAEPDYHVYAMMTPDDPFYQSGDQWYIDAVNAPAAWDSTTGDASQIIGIIDTGVDWDHPDLNDNIWTNQAEVDGVTGIDDDANGYVDDIRGWDFINDDNDPNDDNSHGTHVAGIAAAESNNGIGITGIAWNARIMPVKMLQSSGRGSSSDLAVAIDYSAQNGATVINMSLGSYGESQTVKIALENAYAFAVLVAAAGNNGYKVDRPYPPWPPYAPMYPACYGFVIGVEATTQSGSRAGFSNFDPTGPILTNDGFYWNEFGHNYEIRAPGVEIYSTFPNGNYNSLNGTSMASPIVSGAVALMKSYNPSQSTEQIFARLIQGANNGILDIRNSLDYELVPDLYYVEYTLIDTLPGCDNDGIADAGETIELYLTVKNAGCWTDSVWTKLRFAEFEDTTTAVILDSTSFIGDISAYATLTGELDPFRIEIDPDVVNNRDIVFEYEIGAENHSSFTGELNITVQNGVEIGGLITENLIYTPNKEYLLTDNLRISEGFTITIKPGTIIKFESGKQIDVRGSIIASGTPDSMIIFTNDDNGRGKGFFAGNASDSSRIFFKYCIFNNQSVVMDFSWCEGFVNVNNNVFINNDNESSTFLYLITLHTQFKFTQNNFFYNNGFIFSQNWSESLFSFNNNNIMENNKFRYYVEMYPSHNNLECIKNNIYSNYYNGNVNIELAGSNSSFNISNNYWGNIDSCYIQSTILDFYTSSSKPLAIISPYLYQPSDSCHGIVWKVDINEVLTNKYDNPYNESGGLGVIGVEQLKFDVYFNRAMDTIYTPFLTFGVREPFTQHVVQDNASWSADSTVWTAYHTIGLETGDGIQTVRVCSAKDMDHFEIPIEDSRFQFVIQAAGALSIEFTGTPGIGKVDLEWPTAETDDILGYNMYRALRINDSTWTDTAMINTNLVTDTTYTDFNVIPDTTYRYLYTIIGTDMSESDFSKAIAATPFSAANGDANGDMSVNVLDIISIVSYMLEDDPAPFLFDAADLNGDDVINILDIIGVISIIINDGVGKQVYANATESIFSLKDNKIMASSNGAIGGYQFMINGNVEDLNVSSEYSMEVVTKKLEEDKMLVMVYSLTGNTIPEGNHPILTLSKTDDITFSDLVVADTKGRAVSSQFGDGGELIPEEFKLEQNYPNPFNASTTIAYQLPQASDVSMKIYNLLGQTVYTQQITDQRAGYYHYTWQGLDNHGHGLPSGLYIYQIKADKFVDSKKMILLK